MEMQVIAPHNILHPMIWIWIGGLAITGLCIDTIVLIVGIAGWNPFFR